MDYAALEHGLMMDRQLSISAIIQHAEAQHSDVDIVSRETHGPLFRYTFADCARRSRRLANALAALGLKPGEHVATLAWNNHRHLESYFAVRAAAWCCTPATRACIPSSWPTSSITPATARCCSTPASRRW